MLLYACAVLLTALSSSILVINIGVAETERVLVSLASVGLFLMGLYGLWAWVHRRRRASEEDARIRFDS